MNAREWLHSRQLGSPLHLDLLQPSYDFGEYVLSIRKDNGDHPGKSVYATIRASYLYLFTVYDDDEEGVPSVSEMHGDASSTSFTTRDEKLGTHERLVHVS